MGNLIAGFGALNVVWKLVIGFVIIFVLFWVTDSFHGGMSSLRKWRYERVEAERMKEVQEIQKQNEQLRQANAALEQRFKDSEKRALEAEMKNEMFESRLEQLGAQAAAELIKTERVLEELDREEAITRNPTDNYTRCTRGRAKLLERGIKSAANINCEQYTGRPTP